MWQPIETAPKDSKAILGWFPERKNIFAIVWDRRDERWYLFGGGWTEPSGELTHWMSMPEPPHDP